jgi:hypothetical protein
VSVNFDASDARFSLDGKLARGAGAQRISQGRLGPDPLASLNRGEAALGRTAARRRGRRQCDGHRVAQASE